VSVTRGLASLRSAWAVLRGSVPRWRFSLRLRGDVRAFSFDCKMAAMAEAFRRFDVTRVRDGRRAEAVDRAATEEPLEVRLHGRPFAVIMRTPGADRELAAGFLLAEGVIAGADDLGAIEHCRDGSVDAENVVNVTLAGRTVETIDGVLAGRRQVTTNSACGLCGRLTLEPLPADS